MTKAGCSCSIHVRICKTLITLFTQVSTNKYVTNLRESDLSSDLSWPFTKKYVHTLIPTPYVFISMPSRLHYCFKWSLGWYLLAKTYYSKDF